MLSTRTHAFSCPCPGTYSTQTVTPDADASDKKLKADGIQNVTLRTLLMKGDYFLGAALANAYTKLVLRYKDLVGDGSPEANKAVGQVRFRELGFVRRVN